MRAQLTLGIPMKKKCYPLQNTKKKKKKKSTTKIRKKCELKAVVTTFSFTDINIKESKQKSKQVRITLTDNQFTFCFTLLNIKESKQKSKHITYSESISSYQEFQIA